MEWYYDIFGVLSLVFVWVIPAALLLAVVVFTVSGCTLTLAGIGVRLRSKIQAKTHSKSLICSTDADCPLGFVCIDGRCMPVKPQTPG